MSDNEMSLASNASSESGVQAWDPYSSCRNVDSFEVRMSRGFLRSSPARWFPGLNSHWLPLFHSTGIDFKVLEVTPLLSADAISTSSSTVDRLSTDRSQIGNDITPIGAGMIDDEPVVMYSDINSRNIIAQAFIPNSSRYARQILLEYLCRRVAISLQSSWSGMENSEISYDSEFSLNTHKPSAWIRVRALINNERVNFTFGLGILLAEKLDGLWRRQIRPTNAEILPSKLQKSGQNVVRIELARLSVAPQSLPSYLKVGSLIDLETPITTNLILRVGDEGWISAALCCCGEKFALETIALSPSALQVVEGATPLCIEFGTITVDSISWPELEQPGALIETEIPVSDVVQLSIRGEKVGRALLVSFEGRFALKIL